MSTTTVRWPAKAYDAEGQDLSAPIKQLLADLRLLEDPNVNESVDWIKGTPKSLQVMTAGATSISKLIATAIAAVGGFSAIATGLNGFFMKVGPEGMDTSLVRTAFILGGSVLGVAVVLALALVVRADVSGRSMATSAQFEARAAVASALLTSFVTPATSISVPGYAIQRGDGSWSKVEEFVWRKDGLAAKVEDDYVPAGEWTGIVSS